MIQPYVTVAQYADKFATMPDFSTVKDTAHYQHKGVDFDSGITLYRGLDGEKFIKCPTRGCTVKMLTHYDDRPCLCCADCLLVERRKDDRLPSARRAKTEVKRKPRQKTKRVA